MENESSPPLDADLAALMLRSFPEAVVAMDSAGRVTHWLGIAEQMFGYPKYEALGQQLSFFFDPSERESTAAHLSEALETTGRYERDIRCVCKDGRAVWVEMRAQSLATEDGRAVARFRSLGSPPVGGETASDWLGENWRGLAADATGRPTAQQRLAFLAEASDILGSSLDYPTTLERAAHLAVPRFADLCTVDVLESGGVRRLAVAHADPKQEEVLRQLAAQYRPGWERNHPVGDALESGRAILADRIPPEVARAVDSGAPNLALARASAPSSYLVVPLIARERVLGAMGFVMTQEGRYYGTQDIALAEALARRAASAIDNARLYAAANESLARLEALSEASQVFAAARLNRGDLLDALARHVVKWLGDSCTIRLLTEDGSQLYPAAVHHSDAAAEEFLVDLVGRTPHPANQGLNGQVVRWGEPLLFADTSGAPPGMMEAYRPYVERFGLSSMLIAPVRVENTMLGTISLGRQRPGTPYTMADQTLVMALADRAGMSLENVFLFEREREARSEAEAAAGARNEFLAIASHELRTPVTGIRAAAQLLQLPGAQSTIGQERLNRTIRNIGALSDRLAAMVEELLDMSRIQADRSPYKPVRVDLTDIIRGAVERTRDLLGERGCLEVTFPTAPCEIDADPARLEQVLVNLLENANKYSPDGGEIQVEVAVDPTTVTLIVSDQGVGLTDGGSAVLFEPFGRTAFAKDHQIPGLGLGLYISQKIVAGHGGRIWAESAGEGRGTQFFVQVPRRSPAEATLASA